MVQIKSLVVLPKTKKHHAKSVSAVVCFLFWFKKYTLSGHLYGISFGLKGWRKEEIAEGALGSVLKIVISSLCLCVS